MIITHDGFEIDFTDAIDVFVFDENDKTKPTFHGSPMKAVDIIVELENEYLFVEVKDFHPSGSCIPVSSNNYVFDPNNKDHFNYLKGYLKYKFRYSFLYRYAEGKVDKPVRYLCLLTLNTAFTSHMTKELTRELPTKIPRTATGAPR